MNDKYAELRSALGAGPTPGPRTIKEVGDSHRIVVRGGSVSGVMAFVDTGWPHPEQKAEQRANALLIAAANPETICALLAERDSQAAEITRLHTECNDLARQLNQSNERNGKFKEALEFTAEIYDDEKSSGENAMAAYEARNMARLALL